MSVTAIKNARLRNGEKPGFYGIIIEDGFITRIDPANFINGGNFDLVIDAGGNLAIPPFIDPHVHLDAVLSCADLPRPNMSGTLLEAIDIWGERKPLLTKEIIKTNARETIKWYIAGGALKIRTHADCSDPRLLTVESLLELKDEVRDIVDIEVVAFPQDGIFTKPEGEALLRRALDMGADVVGGAPHLEYTREDGIRDVELVYDLAEAYGKPVDIHIDETGDPQSRFIEVMAKENILRGMGKKASASHATAMHNYNNDYAFKLCGLLKKAEMNMIVNPFDNAVLQNRLDGYPRGRGITRVDELLARGINVCIGHDSVMDPWYGLGRADMLAAANLLAHLGHLNGHGDLSKLMDMITTNSAATLGVEERYGIAEGKPGDMVILDCASDAQAIRLGSERLYVIRRGNIVAEAQPAKHRVIMGENSFSVDFKRFDL
jgi:cytosine deaminase